MKLDLRDRRAQSCRHGKQICCEWIFGDIVRKATPTFTLDPGPMALGEMYWQVIQSICAAAAKSLQSCPTLYDPINGSPPGSPVPGILQARTLEWVAISFSNA